jgi:hypothetical protein
MSVLGFLTKSRKKHSNGIQISVHTISILFHFRNQILQTIVKKSQHVDEKFKISSSDIYKQCGNFTFLFFFFLERTYMF